MKSLYSSPLRVYLALGLLAFFGILMALELPVSLFPNASQPKISAGLSYGGLSAEDFALKTGSRIEYRLRSLHSKTLKVEKVEADYGRDSVHYNIQYGWGNDPAEAKRETENLLHNDTSGLSKEVRDSLWVSMREQNSGFFAASFYSDTRDINSVYAEIDPLLSPRLTQIPDLQSGSIWNPEQKKLIVELRPERLATLQLFPSQIETAISNFAQGFSSGVLRGATDSHGIEMKNPALTIDDLRKMPLRTEKGTLLLQDVAQVDLRVNTESQEVFKTSGAPSIILFAQPKSDGNVKRMSEDITKLIEEVRPNFAPDIKYKVLVDPSEFIRGAVEHVFIEVLIGSLLAVIILFFFIGSMKNVITAAIEIPLSMVVAFILMRWSGMNLNLISLGGLALASGMNVDGSVVVMENIFRHFELSSAKNPTHIMTYQEKRDLIVRAVSEVRLPIIASTVASLVVFAPLAFTSDLTYAVLGDLAKTVIFSHGVSAFIALLLVPTVRLQLLSKVKYVAAEIGHSPIEPTLKKLEAVYHRGLAKFLSKPKMVLASWIGIPVLLGALIFLVVPSLPKEVLGKPDTDWIILGATSSVPLTHAKQNEALLEEIESRLMGKFGDEIAYTFVQINGTQYGHVMARLKDKSHMQKLWKDLEKEFESTPNISYWIEPWNPAELQLPDPPEVEIALEGSTPKNRANATESLLALLQESSDLKRWYSTPGAREADTIVLRTMPEWTTLISPNAVSDLIRIATEGREIHNLSFEGKSYSVQMKFPPDSIRTPEDLGAFPIGAGGKILPLRSFAKVSLEPSSGTLRRVNGRDLYLINGKKESSDKQPVPSKTIQKIHKVVEEWKKSSALAEKVTITFEPAKKEVDDAVNQLLIAVALSILLIFVTMIFQLGGILNALVVLVAIPLGLIGVLAALFIFQSSLSLNSILGVILLNGISVANSILLVDQGERYYTEGYSPEQSVTEAASRRLRPILITSLTTILGMLPIAFGFGQGGRVLQPLGIAVSGGLWISMLLTLFLVPSLHRRVLEKRTRNGLPGEAKT